MIIRDQTRNLRRRRILLAAIPLAIIALVVALFLFPPGKETLYPTYFCDAERTTEGEGGEFFLGKDDVRYGESMNQSDITARNGNYSCMPSLDIPYGMTLILRDLQPGEQYEARVWRKSGSDRGDLVIDPSWGDASAGRPTGLVDGDWMELKHQIRVPHFVKGGTAKFYVYRPGKETAFFDDFSIERIPGSSREEMALMPIDSVRTINLVIEDAQYRKLDRKRAEAMERGLLVTGDNDWVKARLEEGDNRYKVKLRLKGDWTDHLKGDKWSFRVKLETGQAWNGMTVFSLQSPETRSYLMEWVYHTWLRQEDILAPRYDFVQLKINGESRGIYAWEEHFAKQLPEGMQRREGPILKLVEGGLWEVEEQYSGMTYPDLDERIPRFLSAEAAPFEAGGMETDSVLAGQFKTANSLLHAYKYQGKEADEIFDLDKLARYYAMVDICKAQHSYIWHNQRFYYNPILSKLEPIGFDGYTEEGPLNWIKKPFIGYARNFRYMSPAYKAIMFERFFNDYDFVAAYVRYLEQYSRPEYIERWMVSMEEAIKEREALIGMEWEDYQYDRAFMVQEAKKIRMVLYPFTKTSVKAYRAGEVKGKPAYEVFNYHCLPVRLRGVGKSRKQYNPFTLDTLLPSYANDFPPEMVKLTTEAAGEYLFFEVPGLDSLFKVDILPWEAPGSITPEQELFTGLEIESNELYSVEGKIIQFKTGNHTLSQDILIPPGYQVRMDGGTRIDLTQGAKFISKSQLLFYGMQETPIEITSSDGRGQGLTLLQVPDGNRSEFHHVLFKGLTNLDYKGWTQTGAVSVYESEVVFSHCRFLNNQSEDGLNIVRSIFTLTDSYLANTSSDAFDADFCNGSIKNTRFSSSTNDAMDFSGSSIYIVSAYVEDAGDKALSFGEESNASVEYIEIKDSQIGVASKDLSNITVSKASLSGVQEGFTVYQKKPEYGPGNLKVMELEEENTGRMYRVQVGSTLELEGRQIEGKW